MLKNLKVGKKLLLLVGVCVLAAGLIGAAGVVSMSKLGAAVDEIGLVRLPSIIHLDRAYASQEMVLICERGLTDARISGEVRSVQFSKLEEALADAGKELKAYELLPQSSEEAVVWKEFQPYWTRWCQGVAEVVSMSRERDRLSDDGAKSRLDVEIFRKSSGNRDVFLESSIRLRRLVDMNAEIGRNNVKQAGMVFSSGLYGIVIVFAAGLVIAVIFGVVISHNITRPLSRAAVVANAISSGDFSCNLDIDTKDEIGELAAAVNRIPAILGQISGQFGKLSDAADAGDLSFRGDAAQFQGSYREIIAIVNRTLDSISGPVNEAIKVLSALKVNDLGMTVATDGLKGDFMKIAEAVNTVHRNLSHVQQTVISISRGDLSELKDYEAIGRRCEGDHLVPAFITMMRAIHLLIADADKLAAAGRNGALGVRADAGSHSGAYRKIVEGVNGFIEAVSMPIQEVIGTMKQVAGGDLTVRIKGNYSGDFAELKDNVNESLGSVDSAIGQVVGSIREVNAGSQQIADASQSLSQGATEQAASLEEISSSMTEVAGQINQNAENAGRASRVSTETRSAAEAGIRDMDGMVEAMRGINVSSQQIAKVNKVIDDIAFQTNLLALNAAVEAARAGAHGKGFAVVADEVRNLAGRSARAAKETAEMIDESTRKVENGLLVAEKSAVAFRQIVEGIVNVAQLSGEIASASNEQAQGVAQINQGLGQIDQVTQQNTAHAEETAAAAEELSGQADELGRLASRFKVSHGGGVQALVLEEGNQRHGRRVLRLA